MIKCRDSLFSYVINSGFVNIRDLKVVDDSCLSSTCDAVCSHVGFHP